MYSPASLMTSPKHQYTTQIVIASGLALPPGVGHDVCGTDTAWRDGVGEALEVAGEGEGSLDVGGDDVTGGLVIWVGGEGSVTLVPESGRKANTTPRTTTTPAAMRPSDARRWPAPWSTASAMNGTKTSARTASFRPAGAAVAVVTASPSAGTP